MKQGKFRCKIQLFLYLHPCMNRWVCQFFQSLDEAKRCSECGYRGTVQDHVSSNIFSDQRWRGS